MKAYLVRVEGSTQKNKKRLDRVCELEQHTIDGQKYWTRQGELAPVCKVGQTIEGYTIEYDYTEERKEFAKKVFAFAEGKEIAVTQQTLCDALDITRASKRLYMEGMTTMTFDVITRIGNVLGFHIELVPDEQTAE